MTIIAATDFSPAANHAVKCAVQLARKLGDSILLVRVLEPVVEAHPELRVPETAAFDAALRKASDAELAKAVSALAHEGVDIEARTRIGAPAAVLAAEAAAAHARYIVMGSKREGALSRLFLGSVAERTVLAAPCPVLLVPQGAAPFDEWMAGVRPLRALVGLDLDSASAAVLGEIAELRRAGACDATFVHAYWPPAEYSRLGHTGPTDLGATDPAIAAVIEREIAGRCELPGGPGANTLRIEPSWGRVGDAIAQDARADRADLVVVGTRQPHGWDRIKGGSSAVAALRASSTAILCVPARAVPAARAARPAIPALRTVLVATDLSPLGDAAVPHAYALLRGTGGVVELCHVHERPQPTLPVYESPIEPLAPAERAKIEAQLLRLVPQDAETLGIVTHVTVIDGGTPATALLQAARRLGADAIVLGSHGRTGLARVMLGSVAEAVLRGFDKPVVVVRTAAS